jgi:hypothetical protein
MARVLEKISAVFVDFIGGWPYSGSRLANKVAGRDGRGETAVNYPDLKGARLAREPKPNRLKGRSNWETSLAKIVEDRLFSAVVVLRQLNRLSVAGQSTLRMPL